MFDFEVKNSKPYLYFGDLERLKLAQSFPSVTENGPYKMHPGNYIVTLPKTEQHRSAIIIHQENVDPYRMLERLEKYGDSNDDEGAKPVKKRRRLETPKIDVIKEDPFLDWYPARYRWSTERKQFNLLEYRERIGHKLVKFDQDGDECKYCVEPSRFREFSDRHTPCLHFLLYHAIDHAHVEAGDNRNAKRLKLSELIFFVNDISWVADGNVQSFDVKFTQMEENTYRLHRSGQSIGFAIHAPDIHDGISMEILLQAGNCVGMMLVRGYCLQPVQINVTMKEAIYDKKRFTSRVSSSQDGTTMSPAFDFRRLPDKIFLEILSLIPWRQRARCRRVDTRWAFISDLALASDTKSVLPKDYSKFVGMQPAHFARLFSVVANGLLELDLNGVMTPTSFGKLNTVHSFRSLRLFVCTHKIINYTSLVSILDKCPNLKSADIKLNWRLSKVPQSHKVYNLDSLRVTDVRCRITDPVLISISDHFPQLRKFEIQDVGFITNSCLSSFVERYSDTLTCLKLISEWDSGLKWIAYDTIGVFDGIGRCQKLEYLSLSSTATIVSDGFMTALANGCKSLATLDLSFCRGLTESGFSSLAALPNLKRVNINEMVGDLTTAFTQIAMNGKLEQVVADDITLSMQAVKTCLRHCPNLALLSLPGTEVLSVDDALEICSLYSRYGRSPRLLIRFQYSPVWKDQRVEESLKNIKYGNLANNRRLVIDCTWSGAEEDDFLEDGGDIGDLDGPDVILDSDDELTIGETDDFDDSSLDDDSFCTTDDEDGPYCGVQ